MTYQTQLVAASARFWRKIGTSRAVRSHPVNYPGVGIISHGWEPARGFDDLPHWRSAICFPNDQCRSLPRGATFEEIPGEGHRMLVPPDSQVWRQMAIAELSTTEAFAACMSCLLCRGLFSCGHAVFVHDSDAWVQRHCLAGRMMCAQLPLDSQV
jgi:hypothetical protein